MLFRFLATFAYATQPSPEKKQANSFEEALQKEQQQPSSLTPEMKQLSPGSSGAIVPQADIKIEKASAVNSYTVGECFERAKKLNDTRVVVRGKVMKVSKMIMGKNWVHIQDGTGYSMNKTHDLVITTQALPEKGSIVTFSGILYADKNFGYGYKYAAIIEDAKLQQ